MSVAQSCSKPGLEPDPLRVALHAQWETVAGGWAEHARHVDARGAGVADTMLERSAPRPGDRVLELACGPGGVGLAAAALVAPDGEVVLSDVAVAMTAIARRRAAALGLGNVSTRELDLERVDEPDGGFDVVLCREGIMLVPDPGLAARELRRILRPGGRAALAVWGERERNPWLGVLFEALGAHFGAPVPPPGVPGPFSLADPDRLAALMRDAGLSDVVVEEVPNPFRAASFAEWLATVPALAGPVARMLAALDPEAVATIRASAQAALEPYRSPSGLEIPGLTLVAAARR